MNGVVYGERAMTMAADFIATAPAPLAAADRSLRLLHASPRFLEDMGLSAAVIGERTLFDLLPQACAPLQAALADCQQGGRGVVEAVHVTDALWGDRWMRLEILAYGEDVLVTAQNVSRALETERRARHAEECVQLASELAGVSFFEIDYAKETYTRFGEVGAILDWDMTFEELQEDVWQACLPADRPRAQAEFASQLEGGATVGRLEYRANRRDGKELWVYSASKVDLDGNGRRVRVIGAQQNITERKRAEEALRRATEEAEAANRAKSEFLANMSHEIRTPMNGVIGMNALLLRSELSAEQRKFAEAVKVSADCLLGIINDILDISKLEAGKVELEAIDFSLATVVEDVVELLSPRATEKSLEIACYLDDRARGTFKGDPTRLRQVLLNLLSNALKFTEQGYVAVEVHSRAGEGAATPLRIEVQDTGIGLSDEAKDKLFQKFQQADGSITRKYGGTGLGLSICRQIVDLMGGIIGVDDRMGGGTIFWVEVALEASVAEIAPRLAPHSLKGVRVLIVDDIELNRSIFARQLEAEGAMVSDAVDGETCLAILADAQARGAPYDIILMDHMMPGLSGDLVAMEIRKRTDWRQPKIVLASSIGAPNKSDPAAQAGFDAFLTKPVRHQVLVTCLGELVAEASAAAPPPPRIEPSPAPEASAPGVRSVHILLAEDNAINTLLACTILEEADYSVDCVVNGREAVEAVQRKDFDLVLMDVQMPEMDGLEATRRIRALGGAASRVPILAMTANAMASDRDACLEAGMDDFVSKPIEPDSFLRMLARMIPQDVMEAESIVEPVDLPNLDEGHLDSLARLLPPARLNMVIEGYLSAAEGLLHQLEACARRLDLAELAREAHDLKGSSGNFGARRLQGLAQQLEQACKAGDGAAAQALVAEIRRASIIAWDLVGRRLAMAARQSA